MHGYSLRRTGDLVRKAFEILIARPDGMSDRAVLDAIEHSFPLTDLERGSSDSSWLRPFEEMTYFGAIAPVKAGWLRTTDSWWRLTEEGRRAFGEFGDPEQFMIEAARLSPKGWFCVHFPRLYWFAGKAKYQLSIEYKLIRRMGLRYLFGQALRSTASWQKTLPLQVQQRVVVSGLDINVIEDLLDYLDGIGAPYSKGGHTVYLPPIAVQKSAFSVLLERFPPNAGLKIMKNPGPADSADYIYGTDRRISVIHRKLAHQHRHLLLVANLLHAEGIGPRLFDLLELQCGNQVWTAYVIEHVSGGVPSVQQCQAGLNLIRGLESRGAIKINLPDGYADEEFQCPACAENAFVDDDGRFKYIDFQNFLLVDYGKYLENLAVRASAASHFGDKSLFRGGRYLYQTIPGVSLPAKRDTASRIDALQALMQQAGVSLDNRLVLDFGCNIGMMMAQYLRLGARWCHGWDRAEVVSHAQKLISALGCTRFSTTGAEIKRARRIEEDIPSFLRPALEGCVVSYLAVQGHFGWLDSLGRIPWSFLIFESHEDDTSQKFEASMAELRAKIGFRVAAVSSYQDGDCDDRTIALLVRDRTA